MCCACCRQLVGKGRPGQLETALRVAAGGYSAPSSSVHARFPRWAALLAAALSSWRGHHGSPRLPPLAATRARPGRRLPSPQMATSPPGPATLVDSATSAAAQWARPRDLGPSPPRVTSASSRLLAGALHLYFSQSARPRGGGSLLRGARRRSAGLVDARWRARPGGQVGGSALRCLSPRGAGGRRRTRLRRGPWRRPVTQEMGLRRGLWRRPVTQESVLPAPSAAALPARGDKVSGESGFACTAIPCAPSPGRRFACMAILW